MKHEKGHTQNIAIKEIHFSRLQLIIFVLVFAGIGFLIWKSFAAGNVKTWDTQADFKTGALTGTIANADGTVTLDKTTTNGGGSVVDGTHYYLSNDEVALIKKNINDPSKPYVTQAWNQIKKVADAGLNSGMSRVPKGYPAQYPYSTADTTCGRADLNGGGDWKACLYNPGYYDGPVVLALARAYAITGNAAYANKAKQWLIAWANTYNPPSEVVGHEVSEPVGFLVKFYLAYDLIRDQFTPTETTQIQTWARKFVTRTEPWTDGLANLNSTDWVSAYDIDGNKLVHVDGQRNGLPTYRAGNGHAWWRLTVVIAAAVAGPQDLQAALDWNWSHKTAPSWAYPNGVNNGWTDALDWMMTPYRPLNQPFQPPNGEYLDEGIRGTIGYGLYTLNPMILIADIARHAGYSHDLFTAQTPHGLSLKTGIDYYSQYLSGQKPDPWPTSENNFCHQENVLTNAQCYYKIVGESQGSFEVAHNALPTDSILTQAVNFESPTWCGADGSQFNSSGKCPRGNHYDNHITGYNALHADLLFSGASGTTTTAYNPNGSITLTHDAGSASHFSNLNPSATVPAGTTLTYKVRTSCNQSTWSNWVSVDSANPAIANIPDGRYFQIEAGFSTSDSTKTPTLNSVSISYDLVSNACQTPPPTDCTNGCTVVDGQNITITGPTRLLADNSNVIVTQSDGTGHRLYPTTQVSDADIRALSGKTVKVVGTAAGTSNNFPINVFSIVDVSVPPPDTTPPSTPGNFKVQVNSSNQVTLSWSLSTDNVGVTGYNIYRTTPCPVSLACDASINLYKTLPSSTTTYTDTGLEAGNSITYQVAAIDAAKNESSRSPVISVTTSKKGDVNNDDNVNILDLSILLSHFGSSDLNGDLNNDGSVNIIDLSILMSNYGK